VSPDPATAGDVVNGLQRLGRVAVSIDACRAAVEMLRAIEFGLVIVDIRTSSDWRTCRRMTAEGGCAVVVVSHLLARDRRYRKRAFAMGVVAYVRKPCTRQRLRETLARVKSGETAIEVLGLSSDEPL
jgi:DNA-binding response OmpR family regulator